MNNYKTFDDYLLVPQFSDIRSRKEIDISTNLKDLKFDLPIISSPMTTITEGDMALEISELGGIGIIHRYCSIERQIDILNSIKEKNKNAIVGAAVGTVDDFKERTKALVENGINLICIDVAHGHHILVKEAIEWIKSNYNIHVMAGNVATWQGYKELSEWGADSVRIGVGGGCFISGTLVNTSNGLKPIEDIIIGDLVYTHDGSLQEVYDLFKFKNEKDIIAVNDIKCTKNHEFYVLDKKYENIVNEDNIHDYAVWIEADALDIENHLLIELEL